MDRFRIADIKLIVQPDSDDPGAAEVLVSGSIAGVEYLFLLDTGAASCPTSTQPRSAPPGTQARGACSGRAAMTLSRCQAWRSDPS